MDYVDIAQFARSWGLAYLFVLFLGICAYALWPRNREKFERASRIPLEED
jgi:cytochrome c oxidase cbb3-type subunit IV